MNYFRKAFQIMDTHLKMFNNHHEMDVEKELKDAIKRRDPLRIKAAFGRLYREKVGLVYRTLIDVYGKDDDTDDDVQESFFALLDNPTRLLKVDRITSYWIKSAKYICHDRRQKQSKIQPIEDEAQSHEQTIPKLLQGKEFFVQIEEWLGQPDADIVIWRAAYGYSEKEIAERLGMGEDAISYRYRKSIKEIRRRMEHEKA